mmetsp:Transcript_64380/g.119693  ORF Transcript_64380/g.119693 Transcript_64380/m.119693 type:complete len:301 (-) Transcript_64380:18-920(-)
MACTTMFCCARRTAEEALQGVTAHKDLQPGSVVEACYALPIYLEQLEGLGMMYRHSASPNATVEFSKEGADRHWMTVKARRHVQEGEEVTIDRCKAGSSAGNILEAAEEWVEAVDGVAPPEPRFCLNVLHVMQLFQQPLDDFRFTPLGGRPDARIEVRHSPVEGLGVFATDRILAGEVVDVCPVLILGADEVPGVLNNYAFEGPAESLARMPLGAATIINHSENFNVLWQLSGQSPLILFWLAIRTIEVGEELFHHYGDEYWEADGIKPRELNPDGGDYLFVRLANIGRKVALQAKRVQL